jgi:hypothetical protein
MQIDAARAYMLDYNLKRGVQVLFLGGVDKIKLIKI